MLSKLWNLSSYLVAIVGGILLFFAFPLSFWGIIAYDYALADIFQNLNVNVELRGFLVLPLTLLLSLMGGYILHHSLKSERIKPASNEFEQDTLNWSQKIHFLVILCLAVFSMLATLGVLVFILMMLMFAFISTYPINSADKYPFYIFIAVQITLALGQFVLIFLVPHLYWRLLQSTRANHAAGNL